MVDVAMRSVTMDGIAQSVAHLSDHILSTLSPKTCKPGVTDCSTSGDGTSDVYEGTLGFINHAKFLQHLCGGPKSWKLGEQSSPPWLQLARSWPAAASKQEKLRIFFTSRNVTQEEKCETVVTKCESVSSEQNRILLEGSPLVESSTYSYPSETLLESLGNTEVNSGSAVSREDLGRATWTFLHTLAAQFPEHPTKQQQRDAQHLMGILSRIYPCKECADHFKDVLKVHPVEAKSGEQLAQWMCRVHNVVNRSLGKAQFPCNRVDFRWGALDCNEGACDLHGRLYR